MQIIEEFEVRLALQLHKTLTEIDDMYEDEFVRFMDYDINHGFMDTLFQMHHAIQLSAFMNANFTNKSGKSINTKPNDFFPMIESKDPIDIEIRKHKKDMEMQAKTIEALTLRKKL